MRLVTSTCTTALIFLMVAQNATAAPAGARDSTSPEVIVYAAASLRDVLEELAPRCEADLGIRLVFNFGASNDLARQIIAANKADVLFTAEEDWMDRVADAGLVDGLSRRSLLSNRLAVIAPAESALVIRSSADLTGIQRLSLANPEAVPAGKYAKAWLENSGVWPAVKDRVLPSLDVRAALAAVESGVADAGIVYRTDAAISRKIRILYEVPEADGPRISYLVAALGDRPQLAISRKVVGWLARSEARPAFEKFGFVCKGQDK